MEKDVLVELVGNLYKYRDLYFETHPVEDAAEKSTNLKAKVDEIVVKLEENQKSLRNKAEFSMLKGKCLNVLPNYDPVAEECLSKAVKLDPKHVEAWNILGECYWKKGDIESAKNCFTGALQHQSNKVSLRSLSMVLRQFGRSKEEKLQFINESVAKAKEAIQLDLTDGTSWFILGNAYLSLFFGGTQNENVMQQCLKAYSQADKDPASRNNPDLHFNRSMCFEYQSHFTKAYEGFLKAKQLDPSFTAAQDKVEVVRLFIQNCLKNLDTKCNLEGKSKLAKIRQSISEEDLGPFGGGSYTSQSQPSKTVTLNPVPFNQLKENANYEVVIYGRVLGVVPSDTSMPYTFVLMDNTSDCIVVTVYNMSTMYGVRTGDAVAIAEPFIMNCQSEIDGDSKSFKFIRVESPMVLVVNGRKLGIEKQAPTELRVTAVSE